MTTLHRITLGGATPLVVSYPTQGTFEQHDVPNDPNVYPITCEADCAKLTIAQMVDVINYLGTKKIKSLHDRTAGAKRLWAILTTRKDPEAAAPAAADVEKADKSAPSTTDEKTLAPSDTAAYEGGQAEHNATAGQENQEADMAKAAKAKKSTKTKKAATPKAGVDKFGLRIGSKNAEAAKLMARASGSTMAHIKEVTGDTKYNLVEKLKNGGHKIKKDGETFFLTAKGE